MFVSNHTAGPVCDGLSVGSDARQQQRASIRLSPVFKRVAIVYSLGIALVIHPAFGTRGSSKNQIFVGESIRVSVNRERPHVEPNIAVNPKNPRHLVATSIAFTRHDSSFTCAVFTSFDGGRSWQVGDLSPLNKLKLDFAGDPWIAFGHAGTVFFSCLADNGRSASTLVFSSSDGGRTWSEPSVVPFGNGGSFDRPSVAVDTTNSKFSGRVYVAASQTIKTESGKRISQPVVARSEDNGRTFSSPVGLFPTDLHSNVSNMVILLDGTLILSFMDYADSGHRLLKTRRLWVTISKNGGQTFSAPHFVAEFQVPDFNVAPYYSPCHMLAVDQSPDNVNNRVYMVWNDSQANATDILLSRSIDRGETWSQPIRVNDNSNRGSQHSTPTIAVNPQGVVGITWYDRRADPNNKCSEIYFSASLDGGLTFLPNTKISPAKFCPDVPGNTVRSSNADSFGVAARWPAGGDYSGLAAGGDGWFHALWADSRTGVYQLWTASVNVRSP